MSCSECDVMQATTPILLARLGGPCTGLRPCAGVVAMTGIKHDQDKDRPSLLPWDAILYCAKVWTVGARKYEARNWEQGLAYSRVFDSTQRHLLSWFQNRETYDPDGTGLRQIGQAAWGCLVLLAYELRGRSDLDDRPPATTCNCDSYHVCDVCRHPR